LAGNSAYGSEQSLDCQPEDDSLGALLGAELGEVDGAPLGAAAGALLGDTQREVLKKRYEQPEDALNATQVPVQCKELGAELPAV
jgi:hypothetical protein